MGAGFVLSWGPPVPGQSFPALGPLGALAALPASLAGGRRRLGLAVVTAGDLGHVLPVVVEALGRLGLRRLGHEPAVVLGRSPAAAGSALDGRGSLLVRPDLGAAGCPARTGTVLPEASVAVERPSAAAAGGASTDAGRAASTTPADRAIEARATSRPRRWRVSRCTMGTSFAGLAIRPGYRRPARSEERTARAGVRRRPAATGGSGRERPASCHASAVASQATRARAVAPASNSQARSRPIGPARRDQPTITAMRPAAADERYCLAESHSAQRQPSDPHGERSRPRGPHPGATSPRAPRRVATDSRPAAWSRSRSARAFAMASAAPARTAMGIKAAKKSGSDPAAPNQP